MDSYSGPFNTDELLRGITLTINCIHDLLEVSGTMEEIDYSIESGYQKYSNPFTVTESVECPEAVTK